MSSKILNFSKDRLITGINIVDGMLFFTDNHTEPKKINIEKFKGKDPEVVVDHSTGTTSIYGRTFAEADITVIKGHPKHALNTNLTDDPIDGGGDIIDLDPSPLASVFFIETHFPTTQSFNNINVRGKLIPGNKQILSQGFYYTFSDSFGDRDDPEDINGIINNIGNGVYDTNADAQDSGFYQFNITTAQAQSQGAVVGGYIHYIAYCRVTESQGGGRYASTEFYFAKEKRSYQLTDTTQAPTGSISDLEITIVKNNSFTGGIVNANVFASCNNTSNLNIATLTKGFAFSKAYREIDNPTTPTRAEIDGQVATREANSQELFPQSYFRDTEIQSSLLNRDKFFLQGGVNFSRLNTGDVYFVYAFIELDGGGGFVYSSVEKLIVDTNVSSEGPQIYHLPADVQETEVGLNANVWSAGGDADLTERGFIFSTEVDNINTVNTIFNNFSTTAPYAYNGSLQINNTFKVPVAIPAGKTGTEQSGDGSGQLHVSTANHLTNLLGGTTLYYIAYAINSRGQRSYAPVDTLDTFNNGPTGMLSVVTSENVIPRIQAGGWNLFKKEINGPFEPIFTFKILGGIADPTKVTSMGIEYAYATGSDPEYGITYENLIKFAENEEHVKIENSGTNINLDVSQFDYTGEDTDEIIGEFKIKDGYGIADSIATNPEDYELVEQIRVDRGDTFLEAFGYTYGGPFAKTLSYYAYVVYDGIKYKSKISRGWTKANSLIWGDLTNYTPRYCGVLTINSPTFFSGGRDASKTHLPENPPTGGTAEIFGAMCPNAPHPNTVGGSLQELGFYWSYEPIDTNDATFDKLTAWANKSTTNKVSATSGGSSGPNVTDPTNPINTSTAAKNWHVGSSQDERGHFEFSATIGPFAAGKTKVYWIPYLLPQPIAAHRGLVHLGDTPVDRFGTSSGGDLLNSFDIGSSITAIDVAPLVKIKNVDNTYSGRLAFTGKAEPGSGNYNINRKGFYIKLKSEFTNPTNPASVKTEMAINTNRITLDTDQFNPGSDYGKTSTFSPGTYIASAFCQIVLADANGVDQTYTVISDNNIESTVGTPQPVDVDTTPVVTIIGDGNTMIGNITDDKGVTISSKGFYVLEVKGSFNSNLQKPVDGNALKAIFNNASSLPNVTAINVSSTTIDGANSSIFRAPVPNETRGYVYYYAAYAINGNSEQDISNTVKHIEYPEIINSFIEIFPIPFSNTIYANNIGKVSATGGNSYQNTVSLKVSTELDSLDNFYADISNWTSGGRITSVNKRSSSIGNFLDINLIDQNFSTQPRECALKIYNATDPSKVIVLSIFQEGNSDTGDEFQGPREDDDIRHAGGGPIALPNLY